MALIGSLTETSLFTDQITQIIEATALAVSQSS